MSSDRSRLNAFDADEVSVVLQQYLASSPLTAQALADVRRRLPVRPDVDLSALLANQAYLVRISAIAEERARCGQDAPSLLVASRPLTTRDQHQLFGKRTNLALIFAAETILFQDTVHALHADAVQWNAGHVHDLGFNVFGVHLDWLTTDGRARRALVIDNDERVKEAELDPPLPLDLAMTIHLPRVNEKDLHRKISSWCADHSVPELNPCASACLADSKIRTHEIWRKAIPHIESPECCMIQQGATKHEVHRILQMFLRRLAAHSHEPALFIQPNSGTEGHLVARITLGSERTIDAAVQAVDKILTLNHALLRNERGNVRFRPPSETPQGFRRATFRVNAAWDGTAFVADSGYAQVAPDEGSDVASRGRGGDIVDINHVLSWLYFKDSNHWRHIVPSSKEVESMKSAACQAAAALGAALPEAKPVQLTGIDLLLEVRGTGQERTLVPVLLEANPRPAGLQHARQILGVSSMDAVHTVSPRLFDGARSLLRSQAVRDASAQAQSQPCTPSRLADR